MNRGNKNLQGWGARVSEDEVVLLLASFAAALSLCLRWWAKLLRSRQGNRGQTEFLILFLAPFAALAGVLFIISVAGSGDVRGVASYTFLYCVLGTAWFMGAARLMENVGISFRDDAVERRNPAAAIIILAAMAAHALLYGCANIGNGPGWWTVVAAASLGSGAWFFLWLLVERTCAVSETITVERDTAAAIRLGGYALAMGLVCWRGAAGDWTSLIQTVIEFAAAWPLLPLTLAAVLVEKLMAGAASELRANRALAALIAAAYLSAGVAGVWFAGPLPHNPVYDYLDAPPTYFPGIFHAPDINPNTGKPTQ